MAAPVAAVVQGNTQALDRLIAQLGAHLETGHGTGGSDFMIVIGIAFLV